MSKLSITSRALYPWPNKLHFSNSWQDKTAFSVNVQGSNRDIRRKDIYPSRNSISRQEARSKSFIKKANDGCEIEVTFARKLGALEICCVPSDLCVLLWLLTNETCVHSANGQFLNGLQTCLNFFSPRLRQHYPGEAFLDESDEWRQNPENSGTLQSFISFSRQ